MSAPDFSNAQALLELPASVRAEVRRCARVLSYSDGEMVFDQDDPAGACYAIVKGAIRFSRRTTSGHQLLMSVYADTVWFGEASLLDGLPRNLRVTAVGKTDLLVLESKDFLRLVESNPEFNAEVMRWLCKKLRNTVSQSYATLTLPLKARLAQQLLKLAKSHGVMERGGSEVRLAIKLSQEDLSGMLGATRQRINQLLRGWQKEGLLSLEGRSIVLLEQDKIAALAQAGEQIQN
jgi:CRP/FNR family transcriptional regulator, cyclic AMP receptor protein